MDTKELIKKFINRQAIGFQLDSRLGYFFLIKGKKTDMYDYLNGIKKYKSLILKED